MKRPTEVDMSSEVKPSWPPWATPSDEEMPKSACTRTMRVSVELNQVGSQVTSKGRPTGICWFWVGEQKGAFGPSKLLQRDIMGIKRGGNFGYRSQHRYVVCLGRGSVMGEGELKAKRFQKGMLKIKGVDLLIYEG